MAEETGGTHPWTQRKGETARAYQAFRTYMQLGTARSIVRAAEAEGKSDTLLENWSASNKWVERCAAYDSYVLEAEVDGFADDMASVRSRHMRLTDMLLDRLEDNLKRLPPGADPSIRWTTAFSAGVKAHKDALSLREDDGKASGVLEAIVAKLDRLESE